MDGNFLGTGVVSVILTFNQNPVSSNKIIPVEEDLVK